jgi:hypothetical protein
MKHRLTIAVREGAANYNCALCSRPLSQAEDLCLCLENDMCRVCGSCGVEHDPALAALLDMAKVAERVGRMGRHVLVPPLGALLELAHAAESYSSAREKRRRLRKAG